MAPKSSVYEPNTMTLLLALTVYVPPTLPLLRHVCWTSFA